MKRLQQILLNQLLQEVILQEICVNLCESVDKQQSGNRTQITEGNGRTTDYIYDDQYRLTSETISNSPDGIIGTVSYTLDAVGNRLTRTSSVFSVSSVVSSYNENDQLDSEIYDANGNVISDSTYTDVYDFMDRFIRREKTDGTIIDLVYNADGIRVSKTVDGLSTNYLTCSNNLTGYAQVLEELNSIGLVEKAYTYGLDLISQSDVSTGEAHYYLYDGLGSVKSLVDETGQVVVDYQFDAFGNLLSEIQYGVTNVANSYRFTGEQFDADLEQYYLRARYFNQDTGRFNRVDPFSGNINDPVSLHRYLGLSANPVMFIDPSGEISLAQSVAIGAIANTFANLATLKISGALNKLTGREIATQLGISAFVGGLTGGFAYKAGLILNVFKPWLAGTVNGGVSGGFSQFITEFLEFAITGKEITWQSGKRVLVASASGLVLGGILTKLTVRYEQPFARSSQIKAVFPAPDVGVIQFSQLTAIRASGLLPVTGGNSFATFIQSLFTGTIEDE